MNKVTQHQLINTDNFFVSSVYVHICIGTTKPGNFTSCSTPCISIKLSISTL